MRRDAQLILASALALSADAVLSNILDLGVGRNLGDGNPMSVFLRVVTAADHTTGDETYNFQLLTDGDEAIGSPTILVNQAILYSALTAGSLHEIKIPQGAAFEQFLAMKFDGAGTTPTVTVDCWVGETGDLPSVKTYPSGRSF